MKSYIEQKNEEELERIMNEPQMSVKEIRAFKRRRRRHERMIELRDTAIMFVIGTIISVIILSIGQYKKESDMKKAAIQKAIKQEAAVPEVSKDIEFGSVFREPEKQYVASDHPQPNATWRGATKSHDISPNLLIRYDDKNTIMNFNKIAAVGCGLSGVEITSEADYGFELTILDDNSVKIRTYDNTGTGIRPDEIDAEFATGNKSIPVTDADEYVITGYKNCPDGLGGVQVSFNNDTYMELCVFKENDELYAANIQLTTVAKRVVDIRNNIQTLLDRAGITEADAVYTDPIYYPIVPGKGEQSDTAYWINKSNELVDDSWSDARKISVFYNYIVDNFAYDKWVAGQGAHARCFYYNDYSGKYNASQTYVGVCEDFSQIMAIMCRAQGIPALNMASESANHSIAIVYSYDYGRWIPLDITEDIQYDAYDEDYTVRSLSTVKRYAHYDNIKAIVFDHVYIGNYNDMANNGIPSTY